jgi:hypothetical protein
VIRPFVLPEDTMDDLKSLALRLLGSPYPTTPPKPHTDLIVGALPPNLPFTLPIPEQARIVGSYMEGAESAHIVMDVGLPIANVLTFYQDKLVVDGWQDKGPLLISPQGFQDFKAYCFVRDRFRIDVSPYPITYDSTDVHFYVHFSTHDLGGFVTPYSLPLSAPLLPLLFAPEGALYRSCAATVSNHYSYSHAIVETSMDAVALEENYHAPMINAGWKLIDQAATEFMVLSRWIGVSDIDITLLVLNTITRPNEKIAILFSEGSH